MSLSSFFTEQFDEIRAFMVSEEEAVRCVRIDDEMKPMLVKALSRMEDDPDFPHLIVPYFETFKEPLQYFRDWLDSLMEECHQHRDQFVQNGIEIPSAEELDGRLKAPGRFLKFAQSLTERLPDSLGALVFLVDPEEVRDPESYRESLRFLSSKSKSRWLKFLVLDQREEPVLPDPWPEENRVSTQTFHLGPEEMERRAVEDLKSPGAMSTVQGRQTLGLLAGFAAAKQDYPKALELQNKCVEQAEKKGSPGERAQAYYNQGNTLLEMGSYADAARAFCKACTLCLENELDSLAPFAYTNLAVSLHRQDAFKDAFESLRVARDMFRQQGQLPGEIHVVDNLARMYAIDGENEKAEEAWLYALKLYEDITNSAMAELRQEGIQDICGKLGQFYQETSQPEKIAPLRARTNRADGTSD